MAGDANLNGLDFLTSVLFIGLAAVMLFILALQLLAVWVVESSALKKYRLRNPGFVQLSAEGKYARIAFNGLLAFALYVGFAYVFAGYVTAGLTGSLWRVLLEVAAILLLYDLMYYLMHRGFHHPWLMKHVHGRHHHVRNPTAVDGLYLDPLDNFAGLGVFFLSVVVVGPISAASFLCAVLVYILINTINHMGLELPHPAFKLANYWARKHDHHHGVNPRSNYASIFYFWDRLFRTSG